MGDNLGNRIKAYEAVTQHRLLPNTPLFVRVDGKAFHTWTKGCDKPFDQAVMNTMVLAARDTAADMQGFKLAYVQSDEATFMLTDFDTHQTQAWFANELSKIVSISASTFTARFNQHYYGKNARAINNPAMFDARAFNVPLHDAANVFVWRQKDWLRNSVQMLARAYFSPRQMFGKKIPDLHEMLHSVGVNWATDITAQERNGTFIRPPSDRPAWGVRHDVLSYDQLTALLTPEGFGMVDIVPPGDSGDT
jgi:tRNA(His) guanylyltransferase